MGVDPSEEFESSDPGVDAGERREGELRKPDSASSFEEFLEVIGAVPTDVNLNQLMQPGAGENDSIQSRTTIIELEERLEVDGFPEMALLWKEFKKERRELSELIHDELRKAREEHTSPLFGKPKSVAALLGVFSTSAAVGYQRLMSGAISSAGEVAEYGYSLVAGAGLALLSTLGLTAFQRRISSPMMKTMGRELAFMLSHENYRAWFDELQSSKSVMENLSKLGVSSLWDAPHYGKQYTTLKGEVVENPRTTHGEFVRDNLRKFLGYFDRQKRKHVKGAHTGELIEGKRSVTKFIEQFKDEINKNNKGELSVEEGIYLLKVLHDEYLKPGSSHLEELQQSISPTSGGQSP